MSSDFEREEHGPVTFYRMRRSLPGMPRMSIGIYFVDGVMIDTGPRRLKGAVEAIVERETVDTIVLTHHHEDHAGNADWLAERLGTEPLVHPIGQQLLAEPLDLPLYRRLFWGNHAPFTTRPLGATLHTPSYEFRVVHSPGHAPDHVVLHEPQQGWIFSGDLYLTARVHRAFDYEDISQLIESIRAALAIPDCEMFCQHTGRHSSHQHQLGRKLDRLLGLRDRAIVLLEEGRSIREIARALDIRDGLNRLISGGEWSSEHLVRGLLRDAGRLD